MPAHSCPTRCRQPVRFFLTTSALLLLGACSSMKDIPPGTPLTDVQSRHGAPSVSCPLPDGSKQVVWSSQPMGHYAWATRVSPDGRTGTIEQVLTDKAFAQVEVKVWTAEQLRCTFGPPADITTVGLPSVRQTVWSYRYMEAGVWHSLMYFYLSDDGVVQRMHKGPDPLYEPDWIFPL